MHLIYSKLIIKTKTNCFILQRDCDECNFKMVEMKNRVAQTKFNTDSLILQEGQKRQDAVDLERCQRRLRAKKANKVLFNGNKLLWGRKNALYYLCPRNKYIARADNLFRTLISSSSALQH